ncbi:serine/threonine-protein kinase 31-like isoform X1 [Lytechinus pictus]|uniref:serine/threonine-protein kinase 31-like isoform X1 n=2 Tax=Lytechinus pictus TaxID=7653 RepID=UPI0030BA27A6
MSNKGSIYVGNLPKTFTENDFRQLFVEMGPIASAFLKDGKPKDGTQMFKYGFVNFEDNSSVEMAINTCQGKVVQGRVLTVRRSEKNRKALLATPGRPDPNWKEGSQQYNKGPDEVKNLQGYEEKVSITHVVDPHTIFVQAVNRENLEKFSIIMSKLQDHCNSAPKVHELHPDRNKIYGAIFQDDGAWYRCRVTGHTHNMAQVIYIDYGNGAEVEINSMAELSDELASISPIAQKIKIIGVAPSLKDSSDEAKQAYSFMESLEAADGESQSLKIIIADGVTPLEDGSLPVQLFQNNINVAQTVNKKFAPGYQEKVVHAGSKQLLSTPHLMPGGAGGAGIQRKNKEFQGGGDVNGINGHKPHHNHSKEMSDLMKRVQNLESVLEQLKDDKFILQNQLLNYKSEAQKKKEEESNKMNNILRTHLSPLTESFQRIKEARIRFSVDPDVKNTIQQAIDLATKRLHPFMEGSPSKEKGDLISLIPDSEPVGLKLQELESMQQVLQNLESKDELGDAMLKRNDARHEAYKALTNFMDDVKKLPIAKRLQDIEDMVNQLESEYSSYLDPTKVMQPDHHVADMECFDEYQAWLEERCAKITPLRDVTNELRAKWCELLTDMNKSFLFDGNCSPSLESSDKLREDFEVAMEMELTFTLHGYTPSVDLADSTALKTKQEQDVREVEVISSTVHALVKALVKEKQTLASLAQVCENFASMSGQLNPWLNNKPDVSGLQSLMKEVKALRSRLRHKLADKRDLEEDTEQYEASQMEELKVEINTIQEKLWTLYQKEDSLLRELSELTANHFPELPYLYPALGITKFLDTNGLVKDGRDLTHLELTPVPGCKKTTVKLAKVNGKPVSIIKVIHLPDKHTLDKMIAYSVIDIPSCMRLHAVYPEKDGSQLSLQLPYMGLGNIETAVKEDGLLSKTAVISVCRDILMALEGLHRLGLVHGGIHPRNVLLEQRVDSKEEEPQITAHLAEFDFTRTTSETALKGFTTETGICFTAPEVNCGLQATSQADIFACGLLLLWALYPTRVFKVEADGTPDLHGCDLPASLTEILDAMLNYSPSKRPSATRVMESSFFTSPPDFTEKSPATMTIVVNEGNSTLEESSLSDIPEGEDNQRDISATVDPQTEQSQQTSSPGGTKRSMKTPPVSPLKKAMTEKQSPGQMLQDSPPKVQDDIASGQGEETTTEKIESVVQEFSQVTLVTDHKVNTEDTGEASDCDSEPPPLEDDEVVIPTLVEGPRHSKEPAEAGNTDADDNSSPV